MRNSHKSSVAGDLETCSELLRGVTGVPALRQDHQQTAGI
jgi:hypothetical protein